MFLSIKIIIKQFNNVVIINIAINAKFNKITQIVHNYFKCAQ